jgi:Concanavalin A-like lectin/glucanases superfamily
MAYRDDILALNPVIFYDYGSPAIGADSSGNSFDAITEIGLVADSNGLPCGLKAAQHDSDSTTLGLPITPIQGTTDFSVCVWVKYGATKPDSRLYFQRSGPTSIPAGAGQAITIDTTNLGLLRFVITPNPFLGDPVIVNVPFDLWDDDWHFCVFRREDTGSSTCRISVNIDGEEQATASGVMTALAVRTSTFFTNPRDGGVFTEIKSASPVIFDQFLSDAQCLALYEAGILPAPQPPVPPDPLIVAPASPTVIDFSAPSNPAWTYTFEWSLYSNFSSIAGNAIGSANTGSATSLQPATTYYFRARVEENSLLSAWSQTVFATTPSVTGTLPSISGYRGEPRFRLIVGGFPNELPPVFAPRNPTPELRITPNPVAGTPRIYYTGDGLPDGGVPYELEGVIDFAFGSSGAYANIQDHLDYIHLLRQVVRDCNRLEYTVGGDVYYLEIQPNPAGGYTQGGDVMRHAFERRPWISQLILRLNVKSPSWQKTSGGNVGAII